MTHSRFGRRGAALGLGIGLAVAGLAGRAEAGTLYVGAGSSGGHDVSATADVTFGTDSVTITLTNTTETTFSADQLLTGFRFHLTGGAATDGLDAAAAPTAIDVAADGTFTTFGPVNLLTPTKTWELTSGAFDQLQFTPNAEYGILGVATNGTFAGANGSITGNAGHNPFAYQTATFTIGLTGVGAGTQISDMAFVFGTQLTNFVPVSMPLPPAAFAGAAVLAGIAVVRRRRRL